MKRLLLAVVGILCPSHRASRPGVVATREGIMGRTGTPQSGDIILARDGAGSEIVVAANENSAVPAGFAAFFRSGARRMESCDPLRQADTSAPTYISCAPMPLMNSGCLVRCHGRDEFVAQATPTRQQACRPH